MLVLFFRNICNILFNKDLCQDLHLLGESYGDCNLFQYFGNDHFKKSGKPPFYIIPSKIWCIHSYLPVFWSIKLMLWEENKVVVVVTFASRRSKGGKPGNSRSCWSHKSIKDIPHINWKIWIPVVNKIVEPPSIHSIRNLVRIGEIMKKLPNYRLQFWRKPWKVGRILLL